ncbi:hypothetical protein CBR_g35001 [Chara braunii]|uniref:Uncharacterized protein n=1 Tax=Chara braunii TaxID=69332 RepID=A0A388LK46_CHABU|nr:hypothetical protein CBR_g35001 [Chara braunii]|eukprot:GBG82631.1 hypothetical protein CBR_g35001 [Chara braunii]
MGRVRWKQERQGEKGDLRGCRMDPMAGHTEGGKEGRIKARKNAVTEGGSGVSGCKKLRGMCSFGWSLNRRCDGIEGLEIMVKSSKFCLGHGGSVYEKPKSDLGWRLTGRRNRSKTRWKEEKVGGSRSRETELGWQNDDRTEG